MAKEQGKLKMTGEQSLPKNITDIVRYIAYLRIIINNIDMKKHKLQGQQSQANMKNGPAKHIPLPPHF